MRATREQHRRHNGHSVELILDIFSSSTVNKSFADKIDTCHAKTGNNLHFHQLKVNTHRGCVSLVIQHALIDFYSVLALRGIPTVVMSALLFVLKTEVNLVRLLGGLRE